MMDYYEELKKLQKVIDGGDLKETDCQDEMVPQPLVVRPGYRGSGKLEGKTAIVTGADSGIGRSAAVYFAIEGADVAVLYHSHEKDAAKTVELIEAEGRKAVAYQSDQRDADCCGRVVKEIFTEFGKIDILVNNAAYQRPTEDLLKISEEQLRKTFETNIYGYVFMTQAVVPHLKEGSTIINTTSVTGYHGHECLIDYASTKGAITAFTRSLASSLVDDCIRVNGVAPGPVWTPFITHTFPPEKMKGFGSSTPMKRAGQPCEMAGAYVFLASDDSSYFTGQVLHANGGDFIHT